jgi:hypothetical protein
MRCLVQLVVLGFLCALAGCAPKITVQVLSNGKLMMYVPKGTKVNWVNETNDSVQVSFPFANPCKGSPSTTDNCIVENGQAIYECPTGSCEDPGIGVKPTTGRHLDFTLRPIVPRGTAILYQVYCDAGGNVVANGPKVHQNDVVSWVPDADDQSFTLSGFDPANACNPNTITNGVACTVGVSSNATYQVNYNVCKGNKTSTATLNVTQ